MKRWLQEWLSIKELEEKINLLDKQLNDAILDLHIVKMTWQAGLSLQSRIDSLTNKITEYERES